MPDEILYQPQSVYYQMKPDVMNAIDHANRQRGISEVSPRDVLLNSIIETDEEKSSSFHNTSPLAEK